jgi:hypothetical protein
MLPLKPLEIYLQEASNDLAKASEKARIGFEKHNPSAGANREDVVAEFLKEMLPTKYGVSTGIALATNGSVSQQTDIFVYDALNNAPLHPRRTNRLWFVEAIFAAVEVKTKLSRSELEDALGKCRRFKALPREFDELNGKPNIRDSLYVLWSFSGPKPQTLKRWFSELVTNKPRDEWPDVVIIPNKVVLIAGSLFEVERIGQPNSTYRKQLHAHHGPSLEVLMAPGFEVLHLRNDSLLTFFCKMNAWLAGAGSRAANPSLYVTGERNLGDRV